MAKWTDIGPQKDFPPGCQICLETQDTRLVVFNLDGQLLVVSNICPHAGQPLGEGERRGLVLTCPYHGYAYNIKTGANIDFPYDEPPVPTYAVRCTDAGWVQVHADRKA